MLLLNDVNLVRVDKIPNPGYNRFEFQLNRYFFFLITIREIWTSEHEVFIMCKIRWAYLFDMAKKVNYVYI